MNPNMDPRQLMLLRGLGGSLPQAPQLPVPQIQRAQQMQPPMPYKENPVASIVKGINDFVTSFKQTQDDEKNRAMQQVERDLRLVQLGVPIDQKKTLKAMKKAGLDLDFESSMPTPAQTPGQGFQMQAGPAGPIDMPGYQPPPQQAQAPPQQGFWDKVKGAIGLNQAPINMNSPAAAWLTGQMQKAKEMEDMNKKLMMYQGSEIDRGLMTNTIMMGAAKGDPKSLEMAGKLGLIQRTPFDQLMAAANQLDPSGASAEKVGTYWLQAQLGIPEMKKHINDLAFKMSDRFGGDMQKALQYTTDIYTEGHSELMPQRTFDESAKIADFALKFNEQYPQMPYNVALLYANSIADGDQVVAGRIEKAAQDNKLMSKGMFERYAETRRLGQAESRIGLEQSSQQIQREKMAQDERQHQDRQTLGALGLIRSVIGDKLDAFQSVLIDARKADNTEGANAAIKGIAAALQEIPPIPYTIYGKDGKATQHTFDPTKLTTDDVKDMWDVLFFRSGSTSLRFVKDKVTGQEKKPAEPFLSEEMQRYLKNTSKGLMVPMLPYIEGGMTLIDPMSYHRSFGKK